ncbi:phospho-sugar mutase [Gracilimonas mengyeensis]|uniref:Phosphoglucomutase n=1 Tax=Gracilimonas mengyeensis TaxID=1302730 RepID=A0A521C4Q6_9BACT|nr:phospho-sugar mutase [Gracilimonas mengyeensis]SMO54325.1 phosphoglucomutase [Gracilimonas mengyeensis]
MNALDSSVEKNINEWLNGNYDEETKQAIQQKLDDEKYDELTDAFYKNLEFGTGGLRGIMGIGSNRVNKYTFGMATQGLSNFLKKQYPDEDIKVVIAHDCRNNSDTLANVVADVFSANGIKVFFFDALRPTPELSFAIRELGCKSGVMLTASHNPKEYNGYKAYGADGGQLVAPYDKMVMDEVQKISDVSEVKFDRNDDLVETIGEEIDERYLEELKKLSVSEEAIKRQKDLKIVFSPIHGTSRELVPEILKRYGFENVTVVEEQMTPDGDFPTVVYPNPEEKEALNMALDKAKEIDADLVMATDPDADRVGIAVKNLDGEFVLLNGNQTGSLIINYMLTAWEKEDKLTGNEYIVKTIVTSYLIDRIADEKGVECFNTLTGFKYIGELMTELEGKKQFIAGGEESYGYLIGEHVRDKDAVVSCAIIAEMTAYYKDIGSSLYEAMLDMYVEYGLFRENLVSVKKEGKAGAEEIQQMMANFRAEPPKKLGGSQVVTIKDYQSAKEKNIATGEITDIDLPKSNVLQFITEDGAIVSARPSGTEPKIKFYCSVNTNLMSPEDYPQVVATMDKRIETMIESLQN